MTLLQALFNLLPEEGMHNIVFAQSVKKKGGLSWPES